MVFKKKKEEPQIKEHHHYYHPNYTKILTYLFIGMVSLILLANIISTTTTKITENKLIYDKCVYECSKDYTSGFRVGRDLNKDNCVVEEFDRTNCLDNCNKLYLTLKVN